MAEHDTLTSWTRPGHFGASSSGVAFAEATIAAACNVQGDAAQSSFVDTAREIFGVTLPVGPNTIAKTDTWTALWLGPRSWLLLTGGASPRADFDAKRDALNEASGALFDLSTSRVAWTLSGVHAVSVLAKACPLDFHPRTFAPGSCAQSLLGHINVLIERWDASTFNVMVARSFARDAWHWLCEGSAQYGYDVQLPASYR